MQKSESSRNSIYIKCKNLKAASNSLFILSQIARIPYEMLSPVFHSQKANIKMQVVTSRPRRKINTT